MQNAESKARAAWILIPAFILRPPPVGAVLVDATGLILSFAVAMLVLRATPVWRAHCRVQQLGDSLE
jgi:hypothetical protein